MSRNQWYITALVLGLFLDRALAQEDAVQSERRALEGTWQATAFEESGKKAGPRLVEGMSFVFQGDQFTWRMEGQAALQGTFTLDPGKKPRQIDLRDGKGKHDCVGIYERTDATLRIRFHPAKDGPRPKAFTTEKGAHDHFLVTLERQKK